MVPLLGVEDTMLYTCELEKSLNMDKSKSDAVSLELNTYTKQEICASRVPELILKNMCAISS